MIKLLMLMLALTACAHQESKDEGFAAWLMEKNRLAAKKIDEAAQHLDEYLANAALAKERNRTTLTLHNAFNLSEGGVRSYAPHLGIFLHLPTLQHKLQLRFTSYDEDTEVRGINQNRYKPAQVEKTYGTSVAVVEQLGSVTTEFRPLVEYTDKLQTSYLFKFSSDAERGDLMILPELQLFARSDAGTGEYFAVNLGYKVTPKDDLVLVNEEQYTDGDNTMTTNHGVKWQHEFDELLSLKNAVIFESSNVPTYHLERTVISTSLRHKLRKNVLHYSVTPYVAFAKSKSFHPLTGIDLNFEIIF